MAQFPLIFRTPLISKPISQVAVEGEGILEVKFISGLGVEIGGQGTPSSQLSCPVLCVSGDLKGICSQGKRLSWAPKADLHQSSFPIWWVLSFRRATLTAVSCPALTPAALPHSLYLIPAVRPAKVSVIVNFVNLTQPRVI